MVKKSFSKLGQGSAKLADNLSSFLTTESDTETPEKEVKIFDLDPVPEKAKIGKAIQTVKKEKTRKTKSKVGEGRANEKPTLTVKEPATKEPAQVKKVAPIVDTQKEADDFRSHSILISRAQLNDLQEKVLLQKIRADKKYSMKKALHEAFSLWLENEIHQVGDIPEDFVTYTALFSESQLNQVQDRVYMQKAKVERNYSLKRALFEAVDLFLKS